LFRIDRNLVNLSTARTAQVDKGGNEAGAAGGHPDAAAFMAEIAEVQAKAKAQEIIDEAQVSAREKAEEIVNEAREKAAQMIVNAREAAEDIRRDAWKDGFEDGSDEGRRSFDEQLKVKIDEDDEKLKNVIRELYEEREYAFDGLEQEVVGLAMDIVRKIISPDAGESEAFGLLVENALRQINPDGKIVIRVGTEEYERFFQSGNARFELDEDRTVTASVIRDVSLKPGDCIIDADGATIDAGLDTQMKYIELALKTASNLQ